MIKSKLIFLIPIFFAVNGAFLIVYGLLTGADVLIIFDLFFDVDHSVVSLKEVYVLLGMVKVLLAIIEKKSNNTRSKRVVIGVLFVSMSICGTILGVVVGITTDSNIYWVLVDFIIMITLSLLYLRYALKSSVH